MIHAIPLHFNILTTYLLFSKVLLYILGGTTNLIAIPTTDYMFFTQEQYDEINSISLDDIDTSNMSESDIFSAKFRRYINIQVSRTLVEQYVEY